MKILLLEYITGGGFSREALPPSLAREGLLMLDAQLRGLGAAPGVELTVMLDARLAQTPLPAGAARALVGPEDDCCERFEQLMASHDAVWPVAPEFDQILFKLCRAAERLGKTLLTPGSETVRLAGDKYATYQCLRDEGIAAVPTQLLSACAQFPGECIVKPRDGAGCGDSEVIGDAGDFARARVSRDPVQTIVQPHLAGDKTSLSCLFKNGRSWLLSVNRQHFDFSARRYRLTRIDVNCHRQPQAYRALAGRIAAALPGLWGYAGIDLIETAGELLVLEINPRLTSSFAGLDRALGVNAAALVLQLLRGEPDLRPTLNKTIHLQIATDNP